MKTKQCNMCGTVKCVSDFRPRKYKTQIGCEAYCRACIRKRWLRYKWRNITTVRKRQAELKRVHYRKNPKKYLTASEKWRAKNPDLWRELYNSAHRKWAAKMRATNPQWRAFQNVRSRVKAILKKYVRRDRTAALVGCSPRELEAHLAKQFKPGMTWDNYGRDTWHIDHIRPCSSFDLTKRSEQRKCFHYTNLQPLWAKENLIKSDKYAA